jgi:hypothetical protein
MEFSPEGEEKAALLSAKHSNAQGFEEPMKIMEDKKGVLARIL